MREVLHVVCRVHAFVFAIMNRLWCAVLTRRQYFNSVHSDSVASSPTVAPRIAAEPAKRQGLACRLLPMKDLCTCVPAQHGCSRSPTHRLFVLWELFCAFVLHSGL